MTNPAPYRKPEASIIADELALAKRSYPQLSMAELRQNLEDMAEAGVVKGPVVGALRGEIRRRFDAGDGS